MAGSYEHIVTPSGNLRSNESFVNMINNLGDAYEMAEELYGMIWWLAWNLEADSLATTKQLVADASDNYKRGLEIAKEENRGKT